MRYTEHMTSLKDLLTNYKSYGKIIDNKQESRPHVIIPDIHGRPDFVEKVFNLYPDHVKVFVGDILHREASAKQNWFFLDDIYSRYGKQSQEFYDKVKEELDCSFNALHLILEYKNNNPELCFFVRGNHDDISCNEIGNYGKYCTNWESRIFFVGLDRFYPDEKDAYISLFENSMSYVYLGPNFIVSHTCPEKSIDNSKFNYHQQFCWSTTRWGINKDVFNKNLKTLNPEATRWYIGHVPVEEGLVRTFLNGKVVQVNHPDKHVILEVTSQGYEAKEI